MNLCMWRLYCMDRPSCFKCAFSLISSLSCIWKYILCYVINFWVALWCLDDALVKLLNGIWYLPAIFILVQENCLYTLIFIVCPRTTTNSLYIDSFVFTVKQNEQDKSRKKAEEDEGKNQQRNEKLFFQNNGTPDEDFSLNGDTEAIT